MLDLNLGFLTPGPGLYTLHHQLHEYTALCFCHNSLYISRSAFLPDLEQSRGANFSWSPSKERRWTVRRTADRRAVKERHWSNPGLLSTHCNLENRQSKPLHQSKPLCNRTYHRLLTKEEKSSWIVRMRAAQGLCLSRFPTPRKVTREQIKYFHSLCVLHSPSEGEHMPDARCNTKKLSLGFGSFCPTFGITTSLWACLL